MTARFSLTHLFLLAIVVGATLFLNWSASSASSHIYNLIIVVPTGLILLVLVATILVGEWKKLRSGEAKAGPDLASTLGDIVLLAAFAALCIGLTTVGFDIATFIFIWVGVHLCGERRLWAPPLFSALFTFMLVRVFGALFPFPMPLLVL